jgi:alkanesulfonate monooxygenase SsuD/methylene tetrahydromethanopterin reductase-like flavin-dependent oxidoreductase (luciferase family)
VRSDSAPITIAANGDRALKVAAQFADTWNTWGGFDLALEDFVSDTVARSRRLEQYCTDIGRDPATIGRSLLLYPRFVDPWAHERAAEAVISRFVDLGFTEFIFYWPSDEQLDVFDTFVSTVMPKLQESNLG